MNKNLIKRTALFLMAVCLIAGCTFLNGVKAYASEVSSGDTSTSEQTASAVSVKEIDYSNLTMTINMNGNSILYYSKDDKKWYEAEGSDITATTREVGTTIMDISWTSATKETVIYLKGDKNKKSVEVRIPKQNTALKVKFDKVDGTVSFTGEEIAVFQWRKKTDYNWQTVPMGENADTKGIKTTMTWQDFLKAMEALRIKGGKIVVRTPGINGEIGTNGNLDVGSRPSKEVNVSITKRGNAPGTAVNVTKLTLNTTTKQEYSTDGTNWKGCSKTMKLTDILPDVIGTSGGGIGGTIKIRTAATAKAGYSKTLTLDIAGQEAAPTIANGYVETSGKTQRYIIQFPDAKKTTPYQYMVVKPDGTFNETKAWKTVTKNTVIKLSKKAVPEGSVIYYRKKGIAANKTKGTPAVLPSAWNTLKVTWN